VPKALLAGYRHIDTARAYGNEEGVGRALKAASLPRDEVFVTSKVPNEAQGYESTLRSVEASLADLGLEELDLHLIHWPRPTEGLAVATSKARGHPPEQGYIPSSGAANFRVEDLEPVEAEPGVPPVVSQIGPHPYCAQPELREYHASKGILTESWSPLAQ